MLIKVLGLVVLLIVAVLLATMAAGARRGRSIAEHLQRFSEAYEAALRDSSTKEFALRSALDVFSSCPRLDTLTAADYERLSAALREAPDPRRVVESVLLNLDSKVAVAALRDDALLQKLVTAQQVANARGVPAGA